MIKLLSQGSSDCGAQAMMGNSGSPRLATVEGMQEARRRGGFIFPKFALVAVWKADQKPPRRKEDNQGGVGCKAMGEKRQIKHGSVGSLREKTHRI